MKIRVAVAVLLPFLGASPTAFATTGGPLTVEVLGWDAATERIYARQVGHDESGLKDCVFYYDVRSTAPARPRVALAAQDEWPDTTAFARKRIRLERTLARLRPLPRDDEGMESSLPHARIVEQHTVVAWRSSERRFIVDVAERDWTPKGDSILVAAYREPRILALRRYRIPGCNASLLVLSCLGDLSEGGYEVQHCAIVGLPGTGVQRLLSPCGVLPCPSSR